jgi:hypothetical protein
MQLASEINPNTASTAGVDEHIQEQYLLRNMYLSDGGQIVKKMFLYYSNFHHLSFFKVGIAPGDNNFE